MTKIQYNQGSGTFSQVLLVGLGVAIGSQFIQGNPPIQDKKVIFQRPYSVGGNTPSYNSYANVFNGEYNTTTKGFEEVVGNLHARLLINQEPLGTEFEKVLNENLWDLYES